MASSSTICTSCLRAARSLTSPRFFHPRAFRNYVTTATYQPPLYLDFLLPSRQTHRSIARSSIGKPPSSTPLTQGRLRSTRHFSSAPFARAEAQAVINPRTNDEGNSMTLSISPRASHRLSNITKNDENPNLALRITVESGGCHGFQYLMNLEDLAKSPAGEEDTVFEAERGGKVVIDESSLELLSGATVDYTMELIGSQFVVKGIPGAVSSCGCGTSFDIKMD